MTWPAHLCRCQNLYIRFLFSWLDCKATPSKTHWKLQLVHISPEDVTFVPLKSKFLFLFLYLEGLKSSLYPYFQTNNFCELLKNASRCIQYTTNKRNFLVAEMPENSLIWKRITNFSMLTYLQHFSKLRIIRLQKVQRNQIFWIKNASCLNCSKIVAVYLTITPIRSLSDCHSNSRTKFAVAIWEFHS